MKSDENKDLKNKKKVSNDLLVKVIQNIIDIDLTSINKSRKRSFSHLNFFREKKISKNLKLLKKSAYEEENEDKYINNDSSLKQINYFDINVNFDDDNNSLNLNKHRNSLKINDYVSQPKIRKNFILKSELYDLNKKDTEQKENNIIINDNKNNIISNNYIMQEEKKIKNIDINQESNYKSNDNLISNYYETDLTKKYSNNDDNNIIINQNEINNNNNNNNEKDKYVNSINSNNNINYNINNYYYSYPYSPMIPYFNYNNYVNINNNQINKNDYINLSKTQSGCQILIKRIISEPNFANEILLPNIKNELKEICTDIFGSPMIKILLLNLNQQSIDLFLNSIKDYMIYISQTENGSRVMQSLIDKIKDNNILLNKLIYYLSNDINLIKIFKSSYGHHFIKYYLSKIHQREFNTFIYKLIFTNFIELSQDKFGVCIVQKAFSESEKEDFDILLKLTEKNFKILINHCFGNYLIQYIFLKINDIAKFNKIFNLVKIIEENIMEYSVNKYSSGVLEKLFEKGDVKVNEHIINYLLNFHRDKIINIIINQNGFYVIKKAMNIKDKNIKKQIIKSLYNNIYKLESGSRNKSIVSSFCEEYAEFLY